MEVTYRTDCSAVDWQRVREILKLAGMTHHPVQSHKDAFEASHTTVFAYSGGQLIGCGRAISDGQYQAAVYDCAVVPEFQGRGIGSEIVRLVVAPLSHCNIILYASPGREGFYRKHGFAGMKTGMALFLDMDAKRRGGFIE
ncbi:MAG: GNAT family N-acetyltransferase [Desulfofustis sp.]|nr:GNAT family N-acetyltransferase [Desulfofustis sp.]